MRTISILNFKGGIGKTSLAINLSDELRRQGLNVVLVDCDRQRNASSIIPGFSYDDSENVVGQTLKEVLMGQTTLLETLYEAREGLYVVPAHKNLELAAKHLTISGPRTMKALRNAVESLEVVDYVLFDHAPSYSPVTDAALLASREMLIPVEMEAFSMLGLLDMINKLTESLAELEHEVAITGIVPSNLDFSKRMTSLYLDKLREEFGERVTSPVRTDAQISKSQSVRQTVWEYNQHSKGAEDYAAIARLLAEQEVLA